MPDHVLMLEELCAAVTQAFRETNASLASAPLPEPGSDDPALRSPIQRETKYALSAIPYSAFYSRHRYLLREMAFSVLCCVATRRVGNATQTVLNLRAPAWWQRVRRPPVCKRIDIHVSMEGTTIEFRPGDFARLRSKGKNWILLLTPEQQIALTDSASPTQSPSSSKKQISVFRRALHAFAKRFIRDRKHHESLDKDS